MPNPPDTILEATSELNTARERAREVAWPAIEKMLAALEGALMSGRLRGLPNLATSTNPCRGLHVRAKRADKGLPFPRGRTSEDFGAEVLVLTEAGRLAFVRRNNTGDIHERGALPDDLRAEDVEHVAETISEACRRHLSASEKATQQYDDLYALAERLRTALEG